MPESPLPRRIHVDLRHRPSRLRALILGFVLTVVAAACGRGPRLPEGGESGWVRVESMHFAVHTDAGEGVGTDIARRLEVLYAALLTAAYAGRDPYGTGGMAPLDVVVFSRKSDYFDFADRARAAAYFAHRRGWLETATIVTALENLREIDRLLLHELTHAFNARAFESLPVWLEEGLAGLYEHTEIDGNEIVVGVPGGGLAVPPTGRPTARAIASMDTRAFYARDVAAPREVAWTMHVHYTHAWALTHMLRHGPPRYRERFDRFLDALGRGEPADAAFAREIVADDENAFEHDFATYCARPTWTAHRYGFNPPEGGRVLVRRMPVEDVHLLRAMLSRQRQADVERELDAAMTKAPESARVNVARAVFLIQAKREAQAIAALERAAGTAPNDPDVHLVRAAIYLGDIRWDDGGFTFDRRAAESLARLTRLAERPIAHAMAGLYLVATGENEEAECHFGQAHAKDPRCVECMRLRALAYASQHDYARAVRFQALAVQHATERGRAQLATLETTLVSFREARAQQLDRRARKGKGERSAPDRP